RVVAVVEVSDRATAGAAGEGAGDPAGGGVVEGGPGHRLASAAVRGDLWLAEGGVPGGRHVRAEFAGQGGGLAEVVVAVGRCVGRRAAEAREGRGDGQVRVVVVDGGLVSARQRPLDRGQRDVRTGSPAGRVVAGHATGVGVAVDVASGRGRHALAAGDRVV